MNPVQTIDAPTLHEWIEKDEVLLIDVRELHEHASAHIPAALLMPLSGLGSAALPDAGGRKIVVMCAAGARSAMAAERLFAHHYDSVYNLHGGMAAWRMAGLEVAGDASAAGQSNTGGR